MIMQTINNKPHVYIASPFFNPAQIEVVETIKHHLKLHDLTYFSPKDDCMFDPKTMIPEHVLAVNIQALYNTDLVVVVTDGKDPGTLFEAGWSHANNLPIIYMWLDGKPGQKFNLVLASTGSIVRSFGQLDQALEDIAKTGMFKRKNWSEETIDYE